MTMRQTIRLFLFIESTSFIIAGVIHSGLLVAIDVHYQAAVAESFIGAILLIGFALTWILPGMTSVIGLLAQACAVLGTLVGVATIAIGVGPNSVPDIGFHLAILAMLAWGLVIAIRTSDVRSIRA